LGINVMVMVYKYGLMELNIKDHLKTIKLMGKEYLSIQMEIFIKEIGLMIKHKVTVYISTKME